MVFGNGIPLSRLMDTARGHTPDVLRERYGDAFLLIDTVDLELATDGPDTDASVRVATARGTGVVTIGGSSVFPLVQKPTSVFDFIAVGRNEGNDLWLPHASVSRFHAYFRQVADGYVVQDAKSENGTFLDDEPVPRQGEAPPVPVTSGQSVRFGDVEATFIEPADLHRLLNGF